MQTLEHPAIELADSLHQFITAWKRVTETFPAADTSDQPGFAMAWADVAFPFYNAVFLTEGISDASVLKQRIYQAMAYLESHSAPGWLITCPGALGRDAQNALPLIAEDAKLASISLTGMALDDLPLEPRPHSELRFVRIASEAVIRDCIDLNCLAYGVPLEATDTVVKEHSFWEKHAFGYVAYLDDTPVATATAIVNNDCLLLFLVATKEEFRRKGYADTTIRYALNTAHEATGITRSVLHATEAGFPVYMSMGYHPVGTFIGYRPS